MARMLVIGADGVVVNVVVVESGSEWVSPDIYTTEPAPDGVGIGWRRSGGGIWQPMPPPPSDTAPDT